LEEVLEILDCYVLGQYLAGENYKFNQYKMIYMETYEITREIRHEDEQEQFIKISKFNDGDTLWVDLLLDTKQEKKTIKKVNEYFQQNRSDDWHAVRLFDDMKYTMRFKSENTFIEFFNSYITKGELL